MNNFLDRIISRFKEFWNRGKKSSSKVDYSIPDDIHNYSTFFDIKPSHRVFCGLPDYIYEKFSDTNVVAKTKVKYYLCLQNKFNPADFEVFKTTSSFSKIVEKSKFNLCEDSDKVDIDFWLHDVEKVIRLRKKILVVGKSYFKNKLN